MIVTLFSIWMSLAWALVILCSSVHFWMKRSDFNVDTSPLEHYPMVTVVVPAHNEDVVIATLILLFDVTYLPDNQVLFLLYVFPVSAWLTSRVNFYLHQRLGLVQDDSEDAAEAYEEMVQKVNQKQAPAFQALLVHWAHNHHFYQIHSREYKRMLKRILRLLNWDFQNVETVYYVSNGNFLVLVEDLDQEVKEYFQEKVREDLTMMHFENKKTDQKIQFQSGSLKLNAQNIDKFHNFDDALSNLERQLETDIIVEY